MPRIKWKSQRTAGLVILTIVIYLLLRIKNYDHSASVYIANTHPNDVWEYVADFSNMKYLNPTITNFNIIAESGNYDHWQYSTEYSENLSHWPYLSNHAVAHFNIQSKDDIYFIHSVHITCLFMEYFCLDSTSEFKFSYKNSTTHYGTLCEETIVYQCPAFLSSFCQREVVFQRNSIMNNLKKHFAQRFF